MLFSTTNACIAVALLSTPSLAVSIAFGNPTFNTISFGKPFPIQWYGGDGTPVTIILNGGNPAALQPVGSVATGLLSTSYTWTPYASAAVKPGVPYVLSIVQSGLTNYSPVFHIGGPAAASHPAHALRTPLPIGTAGFYPLQNPMGLEDPAIHARHEATGIIYPRNDATGVLAPRHDATGILRRDSHAGVVRTKVIGSGPVCTTRYEQLQVFCEGMGADGNPWLNVYLLTGFPSTPKPTPDIEKRAVFATATYGPIYSTGTGTGSSPAYATGGRYSNGTATGTFDRAAAAVQPAIEATYSSVKEICDDAAIYGSHFDGCPNGAHAMGADVRAMMVVVSAACALLMFLV